jgi:hypothetical protein
VKRIALVALLWGCSEIFGGLDRVVAIDITGPLAVELEEGDTLRLHARAISAAGDSVPDADLWWERVDTTSAALHLDSASGLVTAVGPGTALVRARIENLFSGTVAVEISPAPDRIAAAGDLRLVVGSAAAASNPLAVVVQDLTTTPNDTLALTGKPVHYAVTESSPGGAPGDALFLAAVADTIPGEDPLRLDTVTGTDGQAKAVVRRRTGTTPPDSVTVTAVAVTARGDTVAGSPVRFVVVFERN